MHPTQIEIVTFSPEYAGDFARLNYQWIESFFAIEPQDRQVLDAPDEQIVSRGGEIFFALRGGEVVGTVALMPDVQGVFELTKMAVAPHCKGEGIGKRLMLRAIEHAMKVGQERLIIYSNTRLVVAINLYIQFGFRLVEMDAHQVYSRANIKMARRL